MSPAQSKGPSLIVYRGSVNSWECDDNRHLNVRFFGAKAFEGLPMLASAIHMPGAFKPGGLSTLLPSDIHMRFLKEAHEENPLTTLAGVLDIEDAAATLFLEIQHDDGSTAGGFTIRVQHVQSQSGAAFPWSARTRDALEKLRCERPAHAAPRSVDPARRPSGEASVTRADQLGIPLIGRGCVQPDQCDPFGRMKPEWFLGRVSDSVPHLRKQWTVDPKPEGDIGGAVLEYRIAVRTWPRAGDLLEMRSAITAVADKTRGITHWILDPETGTPWATAEAVAISLDRVARKAVSTPPEILAALQKRVISGMKL